MNKIKNHITQNYIIYLIILLILIIIAAIKFVPRTKPTLLDTSMFTEVSTKEALDLFDNSDTKAQVLLIGRKDCSACINFEPILKIAIATSHFYINYLELDNIDINSEEGTKFLEKLNYTYTYEDETKPFSDYLGITPMFIVIKNGQMVYGKLGTMTLEQVNEVVKKYGANYE